MPEKNKLQPDMSPEFHLRKPLSFYEKKDMMVLISILKEVKGSKKPTQAAIHAKLIKELIKVKPASLFVLVAGFIKCRNYWEMVRELTDEELTKCLADIPAEIEEKELNNILAEKFSVVAKKLEQEFLNDLKDHLKNLGIADFPIQNWDERQKFKGYQADLKPNIPDPSEQDIEATEKSFLKKKALLLKKAKSRMIKAQPNLAHINFDKLTTYACHSYMLGEDAYFKKFDHGGVLHLGPVPSFLKRIFSREDLTWDAFSHAENNTKKTKISLVRSKSTPIVSTPQQSTYPSLAERRRYKFFAPLVISRGEQKNEKSPGKLSPKTDRKMRALIELFSKSPPSEHKALALSEEEATKLLLKLG